MARLTHLHAPQLERIGPEGMSPEGSVELQTILRVVARELKELGRLAGDLQVGLSPLGRSPDAEAGAGDIDLCGAALGSLHSLDLLTQELHALAMFLEVLAPSLPAHWTGNAAGAAQTVTLSELARRLATPVLGEARTQEVETGSLEIFEMTDV